MPVVRHAETRRTEMPSGVATTLASPTLGSAERPIWRVDMHPGESGPEHLFDVEQVWTVLAGAATVELDGQSVELGVGDTVIMPPGVPRRVTADAEHGFTAIVTAPAGARASMLDGTDRGVPAWIE